MDITLIDGTDVELREGWNCCEGASDCGSVIDVYDKESGDLLAEFPGSLPDEDDEELDLGAFTAWISQEVDEYEG